MINLIDNVVRKKKIEKKENYWFNVSKFGLLKYKIGLFKILKNNFSINAL